MLDFIPGLRVSAAVRRVLMAMLQAPPLTTEYMDRADRAVGGHNGWHDFYTLMSLSKGRFYSPWMREATKGHVPYEDLGLDPERMRRWHPLNRELCLSGRCHLPGLLAQRQGRPRGDAQLGRDALPVPR